jgi:hypothetical protein
MTLKNQRTVLIIAGLVLGYGGILLGGPAALLGLVGIALEVWGCYIWAKIKGRNAAWCLLGMLSPIGLIVFFLLKDKSSAAGGQTYEGQGRIVP